MMEEKRPVQTDSAKQAIRAEAKRRERAFLQDPGLAAAEAGSIWQQVEELPAFRQADTVLVYLDIPGEVPTEDLLRRWPGKRFCIPRVDKDALVLHAYHPQRIHSGYKGIREPDADTDIIPPEDVDLALVPGIAFAPATQNHGGCTSDGKAFQRLGHGGGFYDRLLPCLRCPAIGIAFRFRLFPELPEDVWDAGVDAVITAY
ncbi:MAG: 5-formyltetrahydrofolate cyclo-ligase [Bacteroidales bacterium]|nr:5-formyltetrahydrofolate cyclo-ligase [Bacteroidales bacterium]